MNDKPKYLIESEIAVRKQMLAGTDYQALKFAEGAISNEDYAEVKAQREAWRAEINELEAELAKFPEEQAI